MILGRTLMSLVLSARRALGGGAVLSTLLDGLISYWPLSEISGVRYDAVGSNDLTDNNTVGAKLRGPQGTVASFVAAISEYLSHATTWDGSSMTLASWVYFDPSAQASSLIELRQGALYYFSIAQDTWSGGRFYAYCANHPNYEGPSAIVPNGLGWYFVVGGYDTVEGKAFLSVNGSAKIYGNAITPATTLDVLNIGGITWGYHNGRSGAAARWSRAISDTEIAGLFASGNGLRYADLPDGLKTGLVSWWELDEVSGVRYDSHGSNDLTDNNTVYASNGGPRGTVASFVRANSETLSHPTLANDLDWSQGVTLLLWHKGINEVGKGFASFGTSIYQGQQCFGLNDQGSSNDVLFLQMELGNYDPKLNAVQGVDSPHQSGTFEWHLLGARYKADTKTGLVSLDGNAPAETGALAAHPDFNQANKAFRLGSDNISFITGRQSCAGVWNRTMSNAEVAALFNGGVPKRYSDLSDAQKVGLVSYWNLDEQSGVRYDSHGTNHLTDNNTVGSVINAGDAMDGGTAKLTQADGDWLQKSDFVAPDEYTISMWVNGGAAGSPWLTAVNAWAGQVQFAVYAGTGNVAYHLVGDQAGGYQYAQAYIGNSAPFFTDAGWFHIAAWIGPDKVAHISLNGGGEYIAAAAVPTLYRTAAQLRIGASLVGATTALVDEVAIWDRVLTEDERAELFALGKGKFYAFD